MKLYLEGESPESGTLLDLLHIIYCQTNLCIYTARQREMECEGEGIGVCEREKREREREEIVNKRGTLQKKRSNTML